MRILRGTTLTTTLALAAILIAGPPASAQVDTASTNANTAVTERLSTIAVTRYDLGDTAFTDAQSGTVSEVRAVVRYPRHLNGRLPLIMMAHGSWWACTEQEASAWPCDLGTPFPSYRGYDYLADELARKGFVVASISEDGINMTSFDYGDRARLINEHLRLWKQLNDGRGPLTRTLSALTGHVDLQRVGTLGHSRGGKGVMWQASDKHRNEWPAGVAVKAVLPLAPVKFDDPEGDNSDTLVTHIPVGVVTSSCDGAVREHGQEYLDDVVGITKAPAYSVSIQNANHNYYNTQWTPPALFGEDDSTCPDTEISPATQQTALVAYAVAFYQRTLHGDRSSDAVLLGRRPLPGVKSTVRVVQPSR